MVSRSTRPERGTTRTTAWRNGPSGYGRAAILFHWVTALLVVGLFALGLYLDGLTYYDRWYRAAPLLHKSVGALLLALTLLRLGWRLADPPPPPLPGLSRWEARAALLVHRLLYLLLLLTPLAGYLIATADGRPLLLAGGVELPALPLPFTAEQQEEVAGKLHALLAWGLVLSAGLHALAALKHHFIDRLPLLRRITGSAIPPTDNTRTHS